MNTTDKPTTPSSAADDGNHHPMSVDMAAVGQLIQDRGLFLTLMNYLPLLSFLALSGDELEGHWQIMRSIFYSLVAEMNKGVKRLFSKTNSRSKAAKQAFLAFISQWYPGADMAFVGIDDTEADHPYSYQDTDIGSQRMSFG
jgi:hypothetical protein